MDKKKPTSEWCSPSACLPTAFYPSGSPCLLNTVPCTLFSHGEGMGSLFNFRLRIHSAKEKKQRCTPNTPRLRGPGRGPGLAEVGLGSSSLEAAWDSNQAGQRRMQKPLEPSQPCHIRQDSSPPAHSWPGLCLALPPPLPKASLRPGHWISTQRSPKCWEIWK